MIRNSLIVISILLCFAKVAHADVTNPGKTMEYCLNIPFGMDKCYTTLDSAVNSCAAEGCNSIYDKYIDVTVYL